MDQHHELLALAGRAPDGWLAIAREALADGSADRLAELFAALDPALAGDGGANPLRFSPDGRDEHDRALVAAVRAEPGAEACWATTRDGTDRVYLVQADADLPGMAAAAQRVLADLEDTPRVEVFGRASALPDYHEVALLAATLLWSATPEPAVLLARVFDGAGAAGPWFDSGHELVVDPAERGVLLDFLGAGEVVLAADARMTDVLTGRADTVPASLRTDGTWVWSDAAGYYLDRHQLALDPRLAAHAATSAPGGRLSPLTRHQVRAALSNEVTDQEAPS